MGEKIRNVGLDVGYGYTKGSGEGRVIVTLPSIVGPAIEVKYHNDLIGNGQGLEIALDGGRWFVGEAARLQSPSPTSPQARKRDLGLVRLLALGALTNLGITGGAVKMVTGLPVGWYADKDALETGLRGPHVYEVNGKPCRVDVADVVIVPQPFGTFFREIQRPDGTLDSATQEWRRARVGILDVGTHTTDYALSDYMRYVEPRSGSINRAMMRVYELVRDAVLNNHDRDASIQDIETATRSGRLPHRGGSIDVSGFVAQARQAVGQAVVGQARTLWGDGDDLAVVLVTGGGGGFFLPMIQEAFPHARIVGEAQAANAVGFYRYAVRKFGQ